MENAEVKAELKPEKKIRVMPPKAVLMFQQLDEKIDQLREKKNQLAMKFGDSSGFVELAEPDTDGNKFIRVTTTDHIDKFTAGETLFKAAAVSRFEVKISKLKNRPK